MKQNMYWNTLGYAASSQCIHPLPIKAHHVLCLKYVNIHNPEQRHVLKNDTFMRNSGNFDLGGVVNYSFKTSASSCHLISFHTPLGLNVGAIVVDSQRLWGSFGNQFGCVFGDRCLVKTSILIPSSVFLANKIEFSWNSCFQFRRRRSILWRSLRWALFLFCLCCSRVLICLKWSCMAHLSGDD